MASHLNMLAVDLGASSGRVILGKYNGCKLNIEEINRFSNLPVSTNRVLYWDLLGLYREIKQDFKIAGENKQSSIASVGIDTWGNDFGLLDKKGKLLSNPVHYRDNRTLGMMEKVFEIIPRESVFKLLGHIGF